jgi:glyoxylase-like metal-dependent hydrolase (beta-lactamase superfamily II)
MGGGGDCRANTIWVLEGAPRAAFIGDLVFEGAHSYVADGQLGEWLANLSRARAMLADAATLYPGHGRSGGLALLETQRRYLQAYRGAVGELARGRPSLTDDDRSELTRRMRAYLPGGGMEFLVGLSADAVASELARGGQGGPR